MKNNSGLLPVLLFKAEDKCVYYRPQYGVTMDGIVSNGSLRIVAKHICNQNIKNYQPGKVDPGRMTEEDILTEVTRFILEDDEWTNKEETPEEEVFSEDDFSKEVSLLEDDDY